MSRSKSTRGPSRPAKPDRRRNAPELPARSDREVCEYIAKVAAELAELANANRIDALAVACDVVREIAQGNVRSPERSVAVDASGLGSQRSH